MSILIVVIHIIVCLALILIVLLQTGKGADMGAAFGGGASQTLFGTSGASTFLSKLTTAAAIIFMLTSLTLAYMAGNRGTKRLVTEPPPAPSQPAAETSTDSATLPVDTDQDKKAPAAETPQTTDEQPAVSETPATGETTQPEEPAPTE